MNTSQRNIRLDFVILLFQILVMLDLNISDKDKNHAVSICNT